MQHISDSRQDRSEMRGIVIEQLQMNQMEKKKKRKKSLSKTLNINTSKNMKLNMAYIKEKRKLEMEMLKLNDKLGTTAKILNLIRYDKSPTPMYKFKGFKEKITKLKKYAESMKVNGKNRKRLETLINRRNISKNKYENSSDSSIITEYLEPNSDDSI